MDGICGVDWTLLAWHSKWNLSLLWAPEGAVRASNHQLRWHQHVHARAEVGSSVPNFRTSGNTAHCFFDKPRTLEGEKHVSVSADEDWGVWNAAHRTKRILTKFTQLRKTLKTANCRHQSRGLHSGLLGKLPREVWLFEEGGLHIDFNIWIHVYVRTDILTYEVNFESHALQIWTRDYAAQQRKAGARVALNWWDWINFLLYCTHNIESARV